MVYKFKASITFSYDDKGTQRDLRFTISADIARNDFGAAVTSFKKYVDNILHDIIALAISENVKDGTTGKLIINYECEQEHYYDVGCDDVYVDSEHLFYAWELGPDIGTRMAVDIQWDTDGNKDVCLPDRMEIPSDVDDDPDAISDYLSDETCFCHLGYNLVYETSIKVGHKAAAIINDLLSGKDVDWDANKTHSFRGYFHNGTTVDIMVCCPPESHANVPEGSPWTQACWYDSEGKQIGCSSTKDNFFGDWTLNADNDPNLCGPISYVVHVIVA